MLVPRTFFSCFGSKVHCVIYTLAYHGYNKIRFFIMEYTTDEANTDEVLYEDKFCKLSKREIELKWYYFPTGTNLRIDVSNIVKVSHYKGASYRVWGSGNFKHWWASDSSRFGRQVSPKGYIFIYTRENYWVKCFTCENVEYILSTLCSLNREIVRDVKVKRGFSIVATTEESERNL